MVLLSLEREKLMYRPDRDRVVTPDAHFPSPRPIDRLVTDRRASLAHPDRAGHGLRVHLEWLGEVAGAKRGGDVAHVRANRRDRGGVDGIITIQHYPAAVGQILEHVRGRVLVDAHDVRAPRLHRSEIVVRPLAPHEHERYDEATDSDR